MTKQSKNKLNRTVTIVITDFVMLPESRNCAGCFKWYNIDDGTLLTDIQEINTLELPKLPETSDGTKLWQWLRLMKTRKEDEMAELAKDNAAMQKVVVKIREMSADEAERRIAQAREKERRDRVAEVQYGEMRVKHETARRMKEKAYSVAEIADITGLSVPEIEAL